MFLLENYIDGQTGRKLLNSKILSVEAHIREQIKLISTIKQTTLKTTINNTDDLKY